MRTVQGILASDYRNLEVIVIDDGSRTDTSDVLHAEFADDSVSG